MCMWEKIEIIVAAAATAEEAAVAREGQRQARADIKARREQGHAFKRGEWRACARKARQRVAAEMAAPEGQKLPVMLGYLRK